MLLTRYNRPYRNGLDNPLALVEEMRREFDRFFGDNPFEGVTSARAPRSTFAERDNGYTVRVEVPGLAADAITISVEDGVLRLAAERNESAPEGFEARRTERVRFRFDRSMTLPKDVDVERIEATVKDGLLTVALPKIEKLQPRQIAVKAG